VDGLARFDHGCVPGIEPAGRSPTRSSVALPSPSLAVRSMMPNIRRSRSASDRMSTERISTSISAWEAMVLTVVPPWTTPTLYVVLGSLGTSSREISAMARPRMWMALARGSGPSCGRLGP